MKICIVLSTRPEIIKQFPLVNEFKRRKIPYETLFTSQHKDLIENFSSLIDEPTYDIDCWYKETVTIRIN